MQQFDFSEEGIKKRQRTILIFSLASMPCIFLIILLTTNIKINILLPACAFTAVFSLLILKIQTSSMNKSMRAMKVYIDNDTITKKFDKGEQSLSFTDIISAKLTQNPAGDYINIVICDKNKKTLHLSGFERMHEIVDLIGERASNDVDITTKQNKIDYNNPVCYISSGITTLVIIALVKQGSQNLEDAFEAIGFSVGASFLLIYKPISKTNLGLKRLETLIGWGMILGAISALMGILTPK